MQGNKHLRTFAFFATLIAAPALYSQNQITGPTGISHVLLISIDGMHALDYVNCANGIAGTNNGAPYCPHLEALGLTGITYPNASTSKPSDSFPGLMALMTGGSPRTVGVFYDVAYDRSLNPPAVTTGNGLAGGPCTPGVAPPGTSTEFDEGIDINQSLLNGGAPGATLTDGGIKSIDSARLERDRSCLPVFPWNFIRTNTIFGVIHQAGGYTAWSDKHPSYSSVSGPGNGTNVDDYYSPEINSIPVGLPGIMVGNASCNPLPDQNAVAASNSWTDSFQNIRCYDTLKVNAILNEISRKTHNGSKSAPVPTLFGMNFQAVSVGQKLIEKSLGLTGGYLDPLGTPSDSLLAEIQYVDGAIGQMVAELKKQGLLDSTLIIISAKHGQSAIDPNRVLRIPADNASLMPPSQVLSPAGVGPGLPVAQADEDDISMIWLT